MVKYKVAIAGSPSSISNKGTVSADGGFSVVTDDTETVAVGDPTARPITIAPSITLNPANALDPACAITTYTAASGSPTPTVKR